MNVKQDDGILAFNNCNCFSYSFCKWHLFLSIFSLILITYAGIETLKISRVVKNEVSKQMINSSVERKIFLR